MHVCDVLIWLPRTTTKVMKSPVDGWRTSQRGTRAQRTGVVIIYNLFARKYFPNEDPSEKRLNLSFWRVAGNRRLSRPRGAVDWERRATKTCNGTLHSGVCIFNKFWPLLANGVQYMLRWTSGIRLG